MPGEVIEVFAPVIRFVLYIIVELFCERMLCGTGRFLIRLFCRRCEPGPWTCGLVGLFFWMALGVGLVYLLKP